MPDICTLVLDDHETFRRRFAELDALRGVRQTSPSCAPLWASVADLLEVHAAAEEALFYPHLLREGARGESETADAINDHNEIRDAIRRASGADCGTEEWWDAVMAARQANSDHMAEEERGALADLRVHAPDTERDALGQRWIDFRIEHAGRRGVDTQDKDVDRYISQHE